MARSRLLRRTTEEARMTAQSPPPGGRPPGKQRPGPADLSVIQLTYDLARWDENRSRRSPRRTSAPSSSVT